VFPLFSRMLYSRVSAWPYCVVLCFLSAASIAVGFTLFSHSKAFVVLQCQLKLVARVFLEMSRCFIAQNHCHNFFLIGGFTLMNVFLMTGIRKL
jgi:hypothetical protein